MKFIIVTKTILTMQTYDPSFWWQRLACPVKACISLPILLHVAPVKSTMCLSTISHSLGPPYTESSGNAKDN